MCNSRYGKFTFTRPFLCDWVKCLVFLHYCFTVDEPGHFTLPNARWFYSSRGDISSGLEKLPFMGESSFTNFHKLETIVYLKLRISRRNANNEAWNWMWQRCTGILIYFPELSPYLLTSIPLNPIQSQVLRKFKWPSGLVWVWGQDWFQSFRWASCCLLTLPRLASTFRSCRAAYEFEAVQVWHEEKIS